MLLNQWHEIRMIANGNQIECPAVMPFTFHLVSMCEPPGPGRPFGDAAQQPFSRVLVQVPVCSALPSLLRDRFRFALPFTPVAVYLLRVTGWQ